MGRNRGTISENETGFSGGIQLAYGVFAFAMHSDNRDLNVGQN
jgi:hypothetical protein